MHLEIDDLTVSYESGAIVAVDGFRASVSRGELVAIVGPTGCGKSTILNAIAGFHRIDKGQLLMEGRPVTGPGIDCGIVFQQHALFDWYTAVQNVAFGLSARRMSPSDRTRLALDFLSRVGLSDFAGAYPYQLSGGMKQRVALARALVVSPSILLCDEPFASLDAQTRMMMQHLLLDLWQQQKMTIVMSTHDIDEAVFVADRILLLTNRPARVAHEFIVKLPRPRAFELRTTRAFNEIRDQVLLELANELREAGWRL
jgi:NitT/TauT family transport system ATP-binding protein